MNALGEKVLPARRKRVYLLSSDENFRREAAARLESLAVYDVHAAAAEDILSAKSNDVRPALIILDVGDGEILEDGRISSVRMSWGSVPIVAVSAELSPDRMRNLVRLNTADWLKKPVDPKDLLNAVTFHDGSGQTNRSTIATFIGASGGAGATTMALAAANHIAGKSSEQAAETCLVDLDFQNASCGNYLNLINEFDLDDVVKQPGRLDVELMDVIKLSRDPGFTLYSFERPSLPFERGGSDFVLKLLDLVAFRYNNVIVDLPHLETPWSNSVLSASDEIFIVFELNIPSLRQAKRLYKKVRELRGNSASVTLVANKHKRKLFGNYFSRGELEKIFKAKNIKSVNFDRELLTDAVNRALLPSEITPRARFNRDLNKLFKERLDEKSG